MDGTFQPIKIKSFVPLTGQGQSSLIKKNGGIVIKALKSPESSFIDRKLVTYQDETLIAANITRINPARGFVFFLHDPDSNSTFSFQLINDQAIALVKRSSKEAKIYRQKAKQKNKDYESYKSWKLSCDSRRFIRYAIFWLWSKTSHNLDDYQAFAKFRDNTNTLITDKMVKIIYSDQEAIFNFDQWKKSYNQEDFNEWVTFFDWKKKYYTSRARHCENHGSVIKEELGEVKTRLGIGFTLEKTRIVWIINGYPVYTYPLLDKIKGVRVGIGLLNGCSTGEIVQLSNFGFVTPCLETSTSTPKTITTISTPSTRTSTPSTRTSTQNWHCPSCSSVGGCSCNSSTQHCPSCSSKGGCSCNSSPQHCPSCSSVGGCSCNSSTPPCCQSCGNSECTCPSFTTQSHSLGVTGQSCSIISITTPERI